MDTTIIELSARGMALVPVTIALVAIIRLAIPQAINSVVAPILSVIVGGALAYFAGGITFLDSTILGGLVVGILASGVYSSGKSLVGQ